MNTRNNTLDRSDLNVLVHLKGADGSVIDPRDVKWTLRLWSKGDNTVKLTHNRNATPQDCVSSGRTSANVASFTYWTKDGVICFRDNGGVSAPGICVCIDCASKPLGVGHLKGELICEAPDSTFPDGVITLRSLICFDTIVL